MIGDVGYAADVVGVFDSGFTQVFPEGRPIKAMVKEMAKVMEHPVESGATITDHRIILPVEIELTLMLTGEQYRDTYARIRALFHRTDTLIVQTKTASYPSMIIEGMPHDEAPDLHDVVPLSLKLREVVLVTAQFQALPPKSVSPGPGGRGQRNVSTVKRGEQTGTEEGNPGGQKKSSVLYGIIYGDGG